MKPGLPMRHQTLLSVLLLIPLLLPAPAAASSLPSIGEFLSAVLVDIEGGPDSPAEYAVVVEKESQTLFLFSIEQGNFREVFREPCSTGEVPGAKDRSGDKKTPEGIYFFIKEHPERDLAPIYGSRAFPIDYPNLMDRLAGRGGNAIWLHGTNKPLEPRDSNGCIVVTNEVIDRLAGYITLNRTPMIIVGKIPPETVSDSVQERQAVTDVMARWEKALSQGTYHEFLSVYHPSFLPDLSWWPEWDRLRTKLKQERISFSVSIERPTVLRLRDQYTVLVDQVLQTPFQKVFLGTRKLFMVRGPGGLRIVGDEDQVLADNLKDKDMGHALVAAGRTLKKADTEQEIAAMVDEWLAAWSSKDIDRYASYYASDFRSQGGADLDAWLRYKSQLNRKYRFIHVTRKNNLKIEGGDRQSTVTFLQTYASNAFKTTGVKKLILKREGNQWKILREMFNQI